jgi:RHS repeat-associated protein
MNTDSVVESSSAGRRVSTFRYDGYGRLAAAHNPNGDTTGVAYDLLNRTTLRATALGGTVQYQWGPNGLTGVVDPAGKLYQFARNALGWITVETDPSGRSTLHRYDATGNLAWTQNRRNGQVSATYDAAGRMLTRSANGATTTYTYDGVAGRWMTAQNSASTDSLKFDEQGRLVDAVTVRYGRTFELASTYAASGVRTRLDVLRPWSPASSVQWNYSPQLDLESVFGIGTDTIVHAYDAMHRDTAVWAGPYPATALRRHLAYTARGELGATTFRNALMNQAFGRSYAYDVLSRIQSVTNGMGDSTRYYSYDHVGELIRSQNRFNTTVTSCTVPNRFDTCSTRDTSIVLGENPFSYDGVGNRTDSGATMYQSTNMYYAFNGFSLQYDSDGDIVRKYNGAGFDQTYGWNDLGQLVSVTPAGQGSVTYDYDGFGRRVRSVNNATGVVTLYLYDGDNLFAEVDQDGNAIRRYTHNPGVDDPQAVTLRLGDGTMKTYYYMTDLSGNVTGLADGSGQVVNRYRYSPFGTAESTSEQVSNPLRFKARELDAYTGLYYNRARWYDPDLGRFISEDPIGLAGGINTYAFAGNDPINNDDPSGLVPECTPGARVLRLTKQEWLALPVTDRVALASAMEKMGSGICVDGMPVVIATGRVHRGETTLSDGMRRTVMMMTDQGVPSVNLNPWIRTWLASGPPYTTVSKGDLQEQFLYNVQQEHLNWYLACRNEAAWEPYFDLANGRDLAGGTAMSVGIDYARTGSFTAGSALGGFYGSFTLTLLGTERKSLENTYFKCGDVW